MTDAELIARLRSNIFGTGTTMLAADRIEALTADLARSTRMIAKMVPLSADGNYVFWDGVGDIELDHNGELRETIEALEAKLATCEKYRDAYAECDRIGTQAVRDLETKLAKTEVINKLLTVIAILNDPNDERFPEAVDLAERFSATLAEIKGGNDAESNL